MADLQKIKKVIAHRFPFLLVDKILEVEEGKRAVGISISIHYLKGQNKTYVLNIKLPYWQPG